MDELEAELDELEAELDAELEAERVLDAEVAVLKRTPTQAVVEVSALLHAHDQHHGYGGGCRQTHVVFDDSAIEDGDIAVALRCARSPRPGEGCHLAVPLLERYAALSLAERVVVLES